MRTAGDVYSLMVGDQSMPKKKLLGTFLRVNSSKLVALLLVPRQSSSLRVEVRNDADWRRRIRCKWHGCHCLICSRNEQE